MRYSPISEDRMPSSRTHLEDPPRPPTPAAIGLGPGPDICAAPCTGKGKIEIEHDIPQLRLSCGISCSISILPFPVFSSSSSLVFVSAERRYESSSLHASDRIFRAKIPGSLGGGNNGRQRIHLVLQVAGSVRPSLWDAHQRCADARMGFCVERVHGGVSGNFSN
jgi:hypothetical protein